MKIIKFEIRLDEHSSFVGTRYIRRDLPYDFRILKIFNTPFPRVELII